MYLVKQVFFIKKIYILEITYIILFVLNYHLTKKNMSLNKIIMRVELNYYYKGIFDLIGYKRGLLLLVYLCNFLNIWPRRFLANY